MYDFSGVLSLFLFLFSPAQDAFAAKVGPLHKSLNTTTSETRTKNCPTFAPLTNAETFVWRPHFMNVDLPPTTATAKFVN